MELQTLEISAESNMFYGFNFKNFNIMNYAQIAKNKSLLKEYTVNNMRTVYLKDGDEFQIQLFNPETEEIAAEVSIEGSNLSNKIVLRPGERIWLERYTNVSRKFKYETYFVDNTSETLKAISQNGFIRIAFYKKAKWDSSISYCTTVWNGDPWVADNIYYSAADTAASSTSTYICDSVLNSNCVTSTGNSTLNKKHSTSSIETGRVGEGSHSNQSFTNVNMDLNPFPFRTEYIKIEPESTRVYNSNDLQKIYCTECGHKLKSKYKYCPYCGNKIE